MKLKSQNKTVMFIKDLSKQMETKKIFCKNLLFNLRTPCPFFLNKKYGPLFRSALGGGGLSKTFFCKIKIMVPLFPPHLSEGGGGVHEIVTKKIIWCSIFIKTNWSKAVLDIETHSIWFKLV